MVNLNGHEAGNGGYSQGTPTACRAFLYSETTVLARLLRLCPEGKMDETRWSFHRINWTLYRDVEEPWMAFSSASDSHSTLEKENMESWLTRKGLRVEDIG
jgi:hypothetical protein